MSVTSYLVDPVLGRIGSFKDTRLMRNTLSRVAEGSLRAGFGCFRVPVYGSPGPRREDSGSVYQNPVPAAAADADAIIATIASATSEQTLLAANADGVQGANDMFPARQLTLTLSTSADWDATNATLTYVDQDGFTQSETLAIPNGGNATVTAVGTAKRFVSLVIPAQSGTGGTADLGVAVLDASITLSDFEGIVGFDASQEPFDTSDSNPREYGDGDVVPVIRKGAVWVKSENAVSAGDAVFVRITSGAGGSQLGAFRNDADTASAVQVANARWGRDSVADGVNSVELE